MADIRDLNKQIWLDMNRIEVMKDTRQIKTLSLFIWSLSFLLLKQHSEPTKQMKSVKLQGIEKES